MREETLAEEIGWSNGDNIGSKTERKNGRAGARFAEIVRPKHD